MERLKEGDRVFRVFNYWTEREPVLVTKVGRRWANTALGRFMEKFDAATHWADEKGPRGGGLFRSQEEYIEALGIRDGEKRSKAEEWRNRVVRDRLLGQLKYGLSLKTYHDLTEPAIREAAALLGIELEK